MCHQRCEERDIGGLGLDADKLLPGRCGVVAEGRMGPLVRLGNHADVVEVIVLAFVRESVLGPRHPHHVEVLSEAVPAFRVGNIISFVRNRGGPGLREIL